MLQSPTVFYVHGQYGSPDEAKHYKPLFPDCEVIGYDYKAQREFADNFDGLAECVGGSIDIISIGASYKI